MSQVKQVKGKKGKKNRKVDPNQEAIDNFLKVPKEFRKDQARVKNYVGFSPFDPDQLDQALDLCAVFMDVANKNPNDPIVKVLEYAAEQNKTTDPELVRWALMNFITHHPSARSKNLRIPSLTKRNPDLAIPKKKKKKIPVAPGPLIGSDQPVEEEEDIELYMNWFREDPNLNEHHEHWHVVYQAVPDPNDPKGRKIHKDRHGELFAYMHRQMLARYDAERLAMNLPLIEPLDDYRSPIPQRYKPNEHLIDSDDSTPFGDREPDAVLSDVTFGNGREIKINDMEEFRKRIEAAIESGTFMDGGEVTINSLGGILEPYDFGRKDYGDYYGGLHGKGHMTLAYISNPSRAEDEDVDPGVMHTTRTAARDPVFYRWHRHIDNLLFKWEENQSPNDFSNSPPVNVQDIILAFKDKLPIDHGDTQDEEANAFGEQQFGGENFNTDVSGNEYVTDTLETKMKIRSWDHLEDSGVPEDIEHLFPREYYYFFRVENTSSSEVEATFRIFLVPEELADSRQHWIELDKFKESLPPNSKKVVSRDCDMSSIIRQPPQKTDEEMDETSYPLEEGTARFCDCGWPFHLLLPRGRLGGMKFKLILFITDWAEDEVPRLSRCGSISYCGAEGPSEKYPDSKPMGFPFDKPFKNNSYEETFSGLNNVAIRDVTISWVDDFPELVVVEA